MSRSLPMLLGLAIVLGFLYWARVVLIPVALAILLTFLLAPAVSWLQRRGLGRAIAVVLVTFIALGAAVAVTWSVTRQIKSLVDTYPRYEPNINAKIATLRARGREGLVDKVQVVAERIASQLDQAPVVEQPLPKGSERPQPVKIVEEEGPFGLSDIWSVAGPMLEPLANAGLVLVLMIFMLINREDLRDRVIALVGQVQLAETTRAFDDAGERISRYLLMQLLVNAGFGVAVMLGLLLIGVPYAPLWGFFAALLRYIPYLGPWLAALLPIALSLLISRDWSTALMVVALFGVLELITNMAVEPVMYGRGIGVSQAALLVSVAFWTWFWGPVGLVLASPLTVCLVVLGKHVPHLRFFETMLGDRPALEPPIRYYQRLLARDQDEAAELAEDQATRLSLAEVYDGILMPALAMARADLRAGKLDEAGQDFVVRATRQIAEELGARARAADVRQGVADDKREAKEAKAEAKADAKEARAEAKAEAKEAKAEAIAEASGEARQPAAETRVVRAAPAVPEVAAEPAQAAARVKLLAFPARDATDDAALTMLRELLDPLRYEWQVASTDHLASDLVGLIGREAPALVCIASVPPGGLAQAKYLCMRARAAHRATPIVVGRFSLLAEGIEKNRTQLTAAGAERVGVTLAETAEQLAQLSASIVAAAQPAPSAAPPAAAER
ncbi:MAG TPA: AI-2E family transporter [Candidatus Saccharimonadia bacterium]|nr:AI-2E family transporter [Candidatus Saccharimonadia bacterium]